MKKVNLPVKQQHWQDGIVDMDEKDIMTARELATHAADIRHIQEDMDNMLKQMEAMQSTLSQISTTLSEARGGWKVLMLIGGASGALGAVLVKAIRWYAENR